MALPTRFDAICSRSGIKAAVLGLALLACCGCTDADGPTPRQRALAEKAKPSRPEITLDYLREHIIAWYPIGWSVRDASRRNVDRNLEQSGWQGFVQNTVLPDLNRLGLKRVMLHNPFGTLPGEPMQFDQYLEAQRAGLDWLTDGFVQAWRPVTDAGIEVIGYIGSPHLDPDSQELLRSGREQAFYRRAWSAIEPLVQAHMSIGYDAAVPAAEDSATYHFAGMMRQRGIRVYVEAVPKKDHPWWFDFPVITREDYWQKTTPRTHASRRQLTGELVRIARVPPADWAGNHGPGEWPEKACRIIGEGDTAVIEDFILNKPGRKLDTLAECARRY